MNEAVWDVETTKRTRSCSVLDEIACSWAITFKQGRVKNEPLRTCEVRSVDRFILTKKAIRFSVRSIRLFPVFDSTFDLIPDSASKYVKAWYGQSFHSKPPNIPAYRPGDPGLCNSRSCFQHSVVARPLALRFKHVTLATRSELRNWMIAFKFAQILVTREGGKLTRNKRRDHGKTSEEGRGSGKLSQVIRGITSVK
ncbi:unnamed protein product [Porites lobata]|uniref:PH domain-containing protein n=1 Tax=Porites lobata TaxID=104759 RepID=A0ABN8Q1G6_9CNID|nr:unnamed protein product [Porites lobata]